MTILFLLAALVIAIPVILYFVAPQVLFQRVQAAMRRKGRLARKSIHVDGIDWLYLEGGPRDAETVVLVHGFGADKDNWSLSAPHITDKYHLIAPDLPGFGESEPVVERDYRIKAQADRLVAFLDALGITQCHLGGNSMGGFIALQVALDYPDRVKSLTLVNNAGVVGERESELQQAIQAGENPLVMRRPEDFDDLMAFVMHKPRPIPGQFKKVLFAQAKRREAMLDKVFADIITDALESPATDRLGEVKAATLIIWGRHDRVIDVSCVPVLEQGINGAKTVIFDHLGHMPMMEDPEAFAKAHTAFIAQA